jgi:hypothetical protein
MSRRRTAASDCIVCWKKRSRTTTTVLFRGPVRRSRAFRIIACCASFRRSRKFPSSFPGKNPICFASSTSLLPRRVPTPPSNLLRAIRALPRMPAPRSPDEFARFDDGSPFRADRTVGPIAIPDRPARATLSGFDAAKSRPSRASDLQSVRPSARGNGASRVFA